MVALSDQEIRKIIYRNWTWDALSLRSGQPWFAMKRPTAAYTPGELPVPPGWRTISSLHTSAVLQKPVHLQIAHVSSKMDEEPGPTPRPSRRANGFHAWGKEFGGFLGDRPPGSQNLAVALA